VTTRPRKALIEALVADARPVRPLLRPATIAALWLAVVIPLALGLMGLRAPFRPGAWEDLLHSARLQLEIALTLLVAASAARAAFRQGVPGLGAGLRREPLLGLAVLAWLVVIGWAVLAPPLHHGMLGKRDFCWLEAPVLSGLASLLATPLLARRKVLRPDACGFLLALSAGVISMGLMQLVCMYEPEHLLIRHTLPVLATAVLGAVVGRYLH